MAANARHLSLTQEHYSPREIVEASRELLGGIDLDPASCAVANETVRAKKFFTRDDDGLAQKWRGLVFLNPPGGRLEGNKSSQKTWWFKLADEYERGNVTAAIFVCFSIELLQTTQVDTPRLLPLPLDFPICFPRTRVAYVRASEEVELPQRALFDLGPDEKPAEVTDDSPPHASCIIYLPPHGVHEKSAAKVLALNFAHIGACRMLENPE